MVAEARALYAVDGDPTGPYISVAEAAAMLGVSVTTCYELLRITEPPGAGIPHVRKGSAYLLHKAEIERYCREGRHIAQPAAPALSREDLAQAVADGIRLLAAGLVAQQRRAS